MTGTTPGAVVAYLSPLGGVYRQGDALPHACDKPLVLITDLDAANQRAAELEERCALLHTALCKQIDLQFAAEARIVELEDRAAVFEHALASEQASASDNYRFLVDRAEAAEAVADRRLGLLQESERALKAYCITDDTHGRQLLATIQAELTASRGGTDD